MLPGNHYLAPGRDGVRPSNKFNAKSLWLDEHNSDSVAIDMASTTRTTTPQHQATSDQDHLGGVRTRSMPVAAEVSQPDDEERTGNSLTTTAHIITSVIGSGVLSLAWAMSNLGWIAGPAILAIFSVVSWYTAHLLADTYRHPKDSGSRNRTYSEAVQAVLGGKYVPFCAWIQHVKLAVIGVGYTITAGIAMVAVARANCFHSHPAELAHAEATQTVICQVSNNPFLLIFGAFQIFLSQIPNLNELWLVSIVAATMSFSYSFIGIGLAIGKTSESGHSTGSISGYNGDTAAAKAWAVLTGIGSTAFAYEFATNLLEIQDTLKPKPASTAKQSDSARMKKSINMALCVTTAFYAAVGLLGYAAFGDKAPTNLLIVQHVGSSRTGFTDPYWLVDLANVFVMVNMLGSYQVLTQPVFARVESIVYSRFGQNLCIHTELCVRIGGVTWAKTTLFKLIWRTLYVCVTTLIAMLLPFFVEVVALIGALGFWPLTIFLPIEMHIRQASVPKWSRKWMGLQALSAVCLLVSLATGAGAIVRIIIACKDFEPFRTKYTFSGSSH